MRNNSWLCKIRGTARKIALQVMVNQKKTPVLRADLRFLFCFCMFVLMGMAISGRSLHFFSLEMAQNKLLLSLFQKASKRQGRKEVITIMYHVNQLLASDYSPECPQCPWKIYNMFRMWYIGSTNISCIQVLLSLSRSAVQEKAISRSFSVYPSLPLEWHRYLSFTQMPICLVTFGFVDKRLLYLSDQLTCLC